MAKYLILLFSLILIVSACKQKKKVPEKKFVSVLSLIEEQVADVDTSLYPIMEIVYKDTLPGDTSWIPRENFRTAAKDFLAIPDLSNQKVAKRYKEETLYDATINRVVITYTPEDPASEEIQKQQLLVTPNPATGDKVSTIIINRVISNRDSALQKNMLWEMDKSFQVTTILQKPGQFETTSTVKVIWNDKQE